MGKYYDGTKLLSLQDINGNKPEIYMCTSNRSAGKTTFFNRMFVKRFVEKGEKFMLLYRYKYELDSCAEMFFKDIQTLFFPNLEMTSAPRSKGAYRELMLNGEKCGYAVAINSADTVKKHSHEFSDVKRMLFDEFQSETNQYCPDEINKFISIHTSVARGQGEFVRYVPVYMLSNPVTILNPYYVEMGVTDRLNDDTKFLKGNGFVLEQGYVDGASKAQKNSGFNKAFAGNKYVAYSAENVYLNDSKVFIEKMEGKSKYVATIKYNNATYGIRSFDELGIIYCDNKADMTFPLKISVTLNDHNVNFVMLKNNEFFIDSMRYYFSHGCFRFKNQKCKEAILNMLKY